MQNVNITQANKLNGDICDQWKRAMFNELHYWLDLVREYIVLKVKYIFIIRLYNLIVNRKSL
jgi:hypothetical protein